ncbi:MAG: hypothetical protein IKC39_02150, partial [Clostridia bacterium]|nr:hypothetical protein [Clostridia bacterium]
MGKKENASAKLAPICRQSLQIGRERERKLFFTKNERRRRKLRQSKFFVKVLVNTIKIQFLIETNNASRFE